MAWKSMNTWAALAVSALCFSAQPARAVCETSIYGGNTMTVPPGGTYTSVGVTEDLISLCMGGTSPGGTSSQLRIAEGSSGYAVFLSATGNSLSAGGYINHTYAQHPGTRLDLYGTTSLDLPNAGDVFAIRASAFDTLGMDVINHGTVQQVGAGMLNFSGTANLVNEAGAYYNMSGGTGMGASSSLLNKGTIPTATGAVSGGGSLTNAAGGVFVGNLSPGTSGERLTVSNSGSFTVAAGQVGQVGAFTNHAGSLVVSGTMENVGGSLTVLGGTLSGSGIINGALFVGGGPGTAAFNPGNSPGTMTINGDFELRPGGVLNLEIVPDGSGGFLFDRLAVSGYALLDGQVNFLVDPSIGSGWGALSGIRFIGGDLTGGISTGDNFSWNVAGRAGSLLAWDESGSFYIDYLAPVPEPSAYLMLLAGFGLLGVAARRRA